MSHAVRLWRYDVTDLAAQVHAHPELWDQNPMRTEWKEGPFTETSDIWLRFAGDPEEFSGEHFPVFYPGWWLMPALHPIVFHMMSLVRATTLGGVMLTRIPAGAKIPTHTDKGSWHAEFYPLKAYVIIQSNPQCVNRYEDEEYVFPTGDAWLFNNLVEHSVYNCGETDRIAAIVCMRNE
jgi:hypothetical protein